MRYAATISVWVRWVVLAAAALEIVYRPSTPYTGSFAALILALTAVNGWLHFRLVTGRRLTHDSLLAIGAADIAVITGAVAVHGGFASFLFPAYYLAIGSFGLWGSSTAAFLGTSAAAVIYTTVCLTTGSGVDLEAGDEKDLFWRIVVMYGTAASMTLVTRFERRLRREAVERERTLQRERVELSHAIHDTSAQTAYMIGIGLETALEQAGDSNDELTATLRATAALSKSAMWELRRPINMGDLFEGRELGSVLESHTGTFTAITSVPVDMTRSGTEPPLSTETRTRLFSIAHNALANAFRHAEARAVAVRLEFAPGQIRLSVADDGVGLPRDYRESGRGFRSMRADAERMGGDLIVESDGRGSGTTVTCAVPYGAE